MPDQAHHLRQLVRDSVLADGALAPGGPVVAVSGARPGVGVTAVTCGAARELARLGQRVIVVDANLARPEAATRLQAHPRGTLADVLSGMRRAVEILAPTMDENVRLLAGANGPSVAADGGGPSFDRPALDRFAAETAALARHADFVLIDAGHGMSAWIDGLWQLARQTLLVATPDPQSLLDAYAAVKLSQHHRHDGRLQLLLQGVDDESEALPLSRRFDETCHRFLSIRPRPAAWLPSPARAAGDSAHQRGLRLLAADLVSDLRAVKRRVPAPRRSASANFFQERLN